MKTYFQYLLELLSEAGELLGRYRVQPDWEPAREALALRALRAGAPTLPLGSQIDVEPVWASADGEPHAAGVRLEHDGIAETFSLAYFYPLAREHSADLVEKKRLQAGEKFKYRLLAFRKDAPVENGAPAFGVEEIAAPLDIAEADLADFASKATPFDTQTAGELPVFLPQRVLDEAGAGALEAGDVETGGLLLGRLYRDRATRDIAVVITAQVPAQHTEGTAAKLSFTADTWAAGRAAIALRRQGEQLLGTWHTHPATKWCEKCPPERQRECSLQVPFFSEDDVLLHRTVFPRAFCVGLVVTKTIDGLRHALFGWRGGAIVRRGFSLLDARPSALPPPPHTTTDHAPPCPQTD